MSQTPPPENFSTLPPENFSTPPPKKKKFLNPPPRKFLNPPKNFKPTLKISQPHSKKFQPQKYVKR